MIRFYCLCKRALRNEQGATAIEYGLVAALMVLGVIAAISGAMNASKAMWTKVDTEVTAASN
jgi:pilus assembly protein Flp/PilA